MMTYRGNKHTVQLDRLATRLTGSQVRYGLTGPRMVMAGNAIFLLASVAGLIGAARGAEFGHPILMAAIIGSLVYKATIELKERGYAPPDERESAIRWKSFAIGAGLSVGLVGMWAVLLSSFADSGMWFPQSPDQWSPVGLFLMGLTTQVSSIVAAWMTPTYATELNADE